MGADDARSRDRFWTAGLFSLALVPRLAHLLTIRDSPFFSILYIDPLMYDEWGLRIAGGQLLSDRPFFLDPLYPYFLGAVFAVFGHRFEAVVAIQGLLGALVPPLIYLAARRWFDGAAAKTAGVFAALYIPSIYFGGLIMKPGLSLFLMTLALWLLARGLAERSGVPHWLATGAVLGLACLTRGNLVLVLPVLAGWILLRAMPAPAAGVPLGRRILDRSRQREAAALVAGAALVLALPAVHNYAVGGELILSTANAGANFYIGNNPSNESGEYQQLPFIDANPKYEQRDFEREALRRSGRTEMSDREISAFWFGESRSWIREQPLDWIRLLWTKTRSFWGAFEIPDSLDYYLYREYAPVLRLPLPGYGLLAPLGLLGAVLALGRRGWPRLLLVFIAVYSASIIAFFVFSRFRMVIAPALFVLAGFAAVELVRRWRAALGAGRRPGPGLLGLTLLLFALFVFVNVPVRARVDTWGYRAAAALRVPTRPETSALGHYNLGLAYAREAKEASESAELLRRAAAELSTALRLQGEVNHARVQVELGKVLARQQRNAEAIEVYRQAAEIEPNDYAIHHALGILERREGRLDAAAAAFGRSLQLAPRHVASATRLGAVLLELERRPEAAQAFRHALRLSPGNRDAREGLRRAGALAPGQGAP